MNSETGKVYEGPEAIAAAHARGEDLVPVSQRVVNLMLAGRAARARNLKAKRRQRDRIEKASRRRNRCR